MTYGFSLHTVSGQKLGASTANHKSQATQRRTKVFGKILWRSLWPSQKQIVRYDTAHGYAHKHLFRPNGEQQKQRMGVSDYNLALTIAEDDVRQNWQRYKTEYFKELEQ
ncbi:MAG: hypothetical protein AAB354_04025 [candidate division KSB1 bacterium]